jgi:AAA domain/UvrD-like helicase C-terminal domain
MSLNEQQTRAIETAKAAFEKGEQFFCIKGGGGVGKTYTAKALIKEICPESDYSEFSQRRVVCVAPTNKAVRILKKSVGENSGFEFKTISSLLGQQPEYDEHGNVKFIDCTKDTDDFENIDVLLCDEISMISAEHARAITERVYGTTKVIGLGDEYQLYPVKENSSSFFDIFGKNTYTLTKIMRQDDWNPISGVIAYSRDAVIKQTKKFDPRHEYYKSLKVPHPETGKDVGYWCLDGIEAAKRQITLAFAKVFEDKDWSFAKVICYRNKVVEEINAQIRNNLLPGADKHEYVPGDLIIAQSPAMRKIQSIRTGKMIDIIYVPTATELQVHSVSECVKTFTDKDGSDYSYKGYQLVCKDEIDQMFTVSVVSEQDREEFETYNEYFKKFAIGIQQRDGKQFARSYWADFYEHKNLFDSFRHAYAITTHFAQGSTYNNVFVAADDWASSKGSYDFRNRGFYTSMSRAKDRLILF